MVNVQRQQDSPPVTTTLAKAANEPEQLNAHRNAMLACLCRSSSCKHSMHQQLCPPVTTSPGKPAYELPAVGRAASARWNAMLACLCRSSSCKHGMHQQPLALLALYVSTQDAAGEAMMTQCWPSLRFCIGHCQPLDAQAEAPLCEACVRV
jgi:hypothetical protein